jgi:hypothetical protein
VAARRNADGSVTVRLKPQGSRADVRLLVEDAPAYFEQGVLGTLVTGDGQGNLLVGGVVWARRVGVVRLRLAPKPRKKK